jgi:hypothetical protein
MREQKFHLRDWIYWEEHGKAGKEIVALCKMSCDIRFLPKQVSSPQEEAEALMKIDKNKVCRNCWNSYTSINSQKKRKRIVENAKPTQW